MSGTKVMMTGADEAEYLANIALSSRIMDFPDGVRRHITLRDCYWKALDRLQNQRGWPISEMAFRVAQSHWLRESFREAAMQTDTDRVQEARTNAADITSWPRQSPSAARFENELRRALSDLVHVTMPQLIGCGRWPSNES